MEIGKLNQRITFLEHYIKVDEIGNHEARWDEAFSCWASVMPKSSTETTEAGVTKEVLWLEFIVRQTADTMRIHSTTHRITFRGISYNIDSVQPNFQSQDYMKIIAGTRKAGGDDDFY